MDERWLPVPDWEGLYEVSDLGRFRSIRRKTARGWRGGKLVTGTIRHDGYWEVQMTAPGRSRRKCFLHHLVLEAFVGLCPEGQEARHGAGGKLDASLANLCWGTRAKNVGPDRVRDHQSNRGEHHGLTPLTWVDVCEIRRLLAEGLTPQNKIAERFRVTKQTITNIKQKKTWAYPPEEW